MTTCISARNLDEFGTKKGIQFYFYNNDISFIRNTRSPYFWNKTKCAQILRKLAKFCFHTRLELRNYRIVSFKSSEKHLKSDRYGNSKCNYLRVNIVRIKQWPGSTAKTPKIFVAKLGLTAAPTSPI